MRHRAPFALPAVALVATAAAAAAAQDAAQRPVDAEERTAVVDAIATALTDRYVFPDVGAACAEHLRGRLTSGSFEDLADPEAFAARLTEVVQAISHDKHMRVRPLPAERVREEGEHSARARARQMERMRAENFGFERVERLEGNVGYLDLRYFAGHPAARETADAAMRFLANVDAIVFDMRRNGGGNPDMIRYLCSYLFDEPTHLNSLYWREGDRTDEFWTLESVPGPRLADVPAFVLTSSYTFSGAEEFTYNLQTRERAVIVGATTGGGANPGGMVPVGERFGMFIPTGRAINPITGTNWEGTGVSPDVAIESDAALEKALELARPAAEAHRDGKARANEVAWLAFGESRARAVQLAGDGRGPEAERTLTSALRAAHGAGLVDEMAINMLGYEMLTHDRIELAIAVFRFNVERHPASANVYDSLAEAYMHDGQDDLAIRFYRRSLELDPGNENAKAMLGELRRGRSRR